MAIVEPRVKKGPIQNKAEPGVAKQPNKKPRGKIAYIMSRFPKLTETFILYEILALETQEEQIELYPLLRARNTPVHPEGASVWKKIIERMVSEQGPVKVQPDAQPLVDRAHYEPFFSWPILRAQLHFLRRKPLAYLGALGAVLKSTLGSLNFFVGVLGIFPKAVYFAYLMENEGITHIHAHFANHPAAAAFIIHRLTGIPYSFTAHGADLQVDQHMLREKVAESAFTVTISTYNKELIVEKCGAAYRDKVKVIYCGIDTQVFEPTPGHEPPATPFTIVCVGTLYEVKGHTYLIEACRLLKERGVDFICNLVGDGPFRASLTEQVKQAGLEHQVKFLGQRTRQEIVDLLHGAHVSTLPSIPTTSGRREGIPVALMEAMACGVPVVSSNISGIPELVENGRSGFLVPPCDPPALADTFVRLQNDPALRKRLGEAGRARVLQKFDLYTNAAALAQHFNRERVA